MREGPHPSCASGVHSGEQERNPCSGAPSAESLPPPPSAAPLLSSSSPSCHLSCPQIRDPSRFPPCSALSFPLPSFISHSVAPSATPLPHVTHRALRVPGPRLGPLSSGQVTFFPNHSHEDPGRLEGLSLAAEIPPSEAIRFGAQGGLQEDGTGARVGHRGEERERSALCGLRSYMHPVVVARNAGPEEGSQEEVGGTDHPAVSSGAWGGDAEPGGRVRHQASHSHPCRASAPRLIRGFILRHEPRCPQNAFFLDHVRTSFLLNLRRQLPRNILDPSWPTPPPALREVCGPSLLTREPPTPSAEGLDNHVTRGASGREGKGPGAGLRGTTREWRGGPGRGGVASACRLPGRGGGARLPGCPDLACAPRPRSSCGSSAGRTWCGSTAGASAPSGSSRYGRGDPGDQPGAAGNVPARRTFTWIYHVTSSGSQLRFRLMHEAEAGEDFLWPVGFIGHTSSPDWEGLPRARC